MRGESVTSRTVQTPDTGEAAPAPPLAGSYGSLLRRMDAFFGAFSMLLAGLAMVGRLRGEVSSLTVALLLAFVVVNLSVSQLAIRAKSALRWELFRLLA